ncbi:MAG: hypothetical protein HQ541_14575 [Mariniphaga sp.]|nr:hypothetical protein [Mariniphaga sp.]
MALINQGKPVSSYFPVAQPGNTPVTIGETIQCRHPSTCVITYGICTHTFTMLWANVPDSFCLHSYGRNAIQLKNALESSFPEFKHSHSVKFLLIKETEKPSG